MGFLVTFSSDPQGQAARRSQRWIKLMVKHNSAQPWRNSAAEKAHTAHGVLGSTSSDVYRRDGSACNLVGITSWSWKAENDDTAAWPLLRPCLKCLWKTSSPLKGTKRCNDFCNGLQVGSWDWERSFSCCWAKFPPLWLAQAKGKLIHRRQQTHFNLLKFQV